MKPMIRTFQIWIIFVLLPTVTLAQEDDDGLNVGEEDGPMIPNPLGDTTLLGLVNLVIEGVIVLLTPIIVLMVIYSGFLFVSAQGNTDKLTKAKTTLGYTLLGALLILGAFALSNLIENTVSNLST